MPKTISLQLSPRQAADSAVYIPIAARMAGVSDKQVALARVVKRSVDARRSPKINLTIELFIDGEKEPEPVHFDYPDVSAAPQVIVVGAGPAGLFAALRLIELGLRPVVLERGKQVSERKKDIALINRNEALDPDSNYAFGEGGAGTFSDGKLFTRSKKRGDYNRALQTFVFHGAPPEILYDAHPHIGSDKLPGIIAGMRATILRCGGQVVFGARVNGITVRNGCATGVECAGGDKIEGRAVILATGHSARDVYEMLDSQRVLLEAKPYAMGVRIEHPQALIDSIQYHSPERNPYLPAATYSLVAQVAGRGVYSFCMCPGGFIVPALTDVGGCVVNGMSPSERNSPYANSGIVTEVRTSDFAHLEREHGALAGLRLQQQYEAAARAAAPELFTAPAQRVADFVAGKPSSSLPATSYIPGIAASNMGDWMPKFIGGSLREGIAAFGRKMKGFVTNQAVLIGVESRTSTPVRIPRDPATLAHPQITGLYPAGEGAGYAGGIISAALDGQKVAEAIRTAIK